MDIGSLVDFWRQPVHKDDSGWIGPGTIVHIEDGTIHIKFQGHIYSCATRHVRNALTFFSYFGCTEIQHVCTTTYSTTPLAQFQCRAKGLDVELRANGFSAGKFWKHVQQHVQSLQAGRPYLLSAIKHDNKWILSKQAKDNPELYCGLLHFVYSVMQLSGCIGFRVVWNVNRWNCD